MFLRILYFFVTFRNFIRSYIDLVTDFRKARNYLIVFFYIYLLNTQYKHNNICSN